MAVAPTTFVRKKIKEISILCLGIIPTDYIEVCINNNITITVNSSAYADKLISLDINKENLKVHIKRTSGMNRLGIKNKIEFSKTFEILSENDIFVEGIYTHIYNAKDKFQTQEQFHQYIQIIEDVDKIKVPIFHISASEALVNYEKIDFINGCRLGITMYGFTEDADLNLSSTFSLYSKVVQINDLKKGDKVGYNGAYIAKENKQYAALLVPVGYKYNMSSTVRKYTNSRMVSVAPLDFVLEQTKMEYGSINPIGLPSTWKIFVDPKVLEVDNIICGSGNRNSKLCLPSKYLLRLPNVEVLDDLAKEELI